MNLLISRLNKFGLSVNESKAYIALLVLNEAKASDIARSAHVPRNKIYEIMDSLHKKGFVEIVPERVTIFRAVNFEDALGFMIEEWNNRIEDMKKTKIELSKHLASLPIQKKGEKGEFVVYKAKKIIYKKLEEMIGSAEKDISLMINSSDLRRLRLLAKSTSRKTVIKILSPITAENKDISRKWSEFTEHRHYETQTQIKLAIIDDREMLIFQTNEPMGLYSKDKQFIAMLKNFYESAWEESLTAENRIVEIETGMPAESLKHIHGIKDLYSVLPELIENSKSDIIFTTDSYGIERAFNNIKELISKTSGRGVKIRCLTVLTKSNIAKAKELNGFMEIRHVDKVHAIFNCFDSSYSTIFHVKDSNRSIYSDEGMGVIINQKDMVATMRQMLESMWEQATDLKQRARELEGKPSEEKIIKGTENIYRAMVNFTKDAEREICRMSTELSLHRAVKYGTMELDRKKASEGVRIRYLMPITKDNINLIKDAMKFAEVRHINFSPLRARIIDNKICIIRYGGEDILPLAEQTCIVSGNKRYVSSMKKYFDSAWAGAMPSDERLKELATA